MTGSSWPAPSASTRLPSRSDTTCRPPSPGCWSPWYEAVRPSPALASPGPAAAGDRRRGRRPAGGRRRRRPYPGQCRPAGPVRHDRRAARLQRGLRGGADGPRRAGRGGIPRPPGRHDRTRPVRKQGLVLTGLALAVTGAAALVWSRDGGAERREPAIPALQAEPVGVGALGRVEPASRIRKLNQPGGFNVARLDRLFVQEGERVEAGQILAVFADAAQKDAAVAQAEASARQARASLARIRAAGRPEEIEAQRARITALRNAEASATREAQRAEALLPSGAGNIATAERNRFAASRAAAERAEAEAELLRLSRPRPEDVAVAEAELAAAEAAVTRARADAGLSRIVAPIAGTVLKVHARPGDQVGADGVLDLADLSALDVVADVYETDLPRLRPGAPAEVVVPGESRRYPAELREIGWLVRRTTQAGTDPVAAVDARTVEVRLRLGEEGRAALERRTNMQVQVAIRP
ncbi:HlyD family efflux transporter periplasmic adaptor subunit [Roseicella aquatilis]|uniref:HlyD family efflux transporter periplasmic adaptor subunit n=1 Tax=Roseicella aquatilis TaxID=2527868 RepID=A0A4R4DTH6_9PROT|nr:HlyD family efflux transporter periplasmic adaptor subunit [Roseicella aquatilis]